MTIGIGIGITTRNRPGQASEIVRRIRDLTPSAAIVVVDDASDEPVHIYGATVYRFDENVGIARAKNKCLEVLDDCEHIFLFDDDAYPIVEDWWKPYVESPEPHLMYVFEDLAGPRKLRDIKRLYADSQHEAWSGPRGVMLYIHAPTVLPVVGGLDPIFGKWGYEHGDWSNRIFNAGLTSWRYGDVAGSDALIHSMDQYEELERSVQPAERVALARKNAAIHNRRRDDGYAEYVEYRDIPAAPPPGDRDVVITHLYSSKPDPQRPGSQLPSGTLLPADALMGSLDRLGTDRVIIVDTPIPPDRDGCEEIVVNELAINVFFQRHLDSWRYLRDHPEIRWVFCVDATDVEMLHEPWDEIEPGKLYIGYEDQKVDNHWLKVNHKSAVVQEHIAARGKDTLINPGVIGGDRETVMAFLHDIIATHFDTERRRAYGHEHGPSELGDMGVVQVVAFKHRDHLVTGPTVVTRFKANERTSAWWKHK